MWFNYSSAPSFVQGAVDLFGSAACDLVIGCQVDRSTKTVWGPSAPNTTIIIIVPDVLIPVIPINPASRKSTWDMTLEEFDAGRAAYENEVRAIKDQAYKMIEDGYSPQEAAEWAYNQRRQLGIEYKNLTPPDLLDQIYTRNIKKFGDPLGPPSMDYYLDQGYTYDEIIESAARPGGGNIIPKLREDLIRRGR